MFSANLNPTLIRSAALAVLLVPSTGLTQSPVPATPIPPSGAPTAAAPSAATQAAVDQRIRTLQSQLGITEAQMPLWSAFAQAMRDNAAATDALFAQRAGAVATMNAPENMRSYAQIARAYADIPERLRVPGFLNADRWIGTENPKISVATYDLDNVGVLHSPPYLAVGGENGSPWTKRTAKFR